MKLYGIALASLLVLLTTSTLTATETPVSSTAEEIIEYSSSSIFQLRIIDRNSSSKQVLGSAFIIDDGSLLATNYHVVSSLVQKPEEYKAVITIGEEDVEFKVISVDVIHDLAILESLDPKQLSKHNIKPLELSKTAPHKGAKLFAIGNPYNIGLTIVEGNYNGLVDNRFFDQIHFSGAVNSGMSGGPTLDANYEVVGINVASAGNQVGFLVPVDKLSTLISSYQNGDRSSNGFEQPDPVNGIEPTDLQKSIGIQLQKATHYMIDEILSNPWPMEDLNQATVVGSVHDAVDCWGNSDTNNKTKVTTINKGCNSRDNFYVSRSLQTGFIEYEFSYNEAEQWPSFSFYNYMQNQVMAYPANKAGAKDVDNYSCTESIIQESAQTIKKAVVYCVRPYILYPGLFDSFYIATSLDKSKASIMEHYTLSAVSQEDAQRFLNHFINQVNWK